MTKALTFFLLACITSPFSVADPATAPVLDYTFAEDEKVISINNLKISALIILKYQQICSIKVKILISGCMPA